MIPVEDKKIKQRLLQEVLEVYLKDSVKTRKLNAEGEYEYVKMGEAKFNAQEYLIDKAREERATREKSSNRKKKLLRQKAVNS